MSAPFRLNMSSTAPDEAHDWLYKEYMPLRATIFGDTSDFLAQHHEADLGSLHVNIFEDSVSTQLHTAPQNDSVVVGHTLSGRYGVSANDNTIIANVGDSLLHNPDAPTQVGWYRNLRMKIFRFDRQALERVATERGNHAQSLRYVLSRPLSRQKAQTWHETMRRVEQEFLFQDAVRNSPLARARAFRIAANCLLDSFAIIPNPPASSGDAGTRAVRRAAAFIEESVDQDIDLVTVAEAARAEPAALAKAFREQRGSAPMEYLQRLRLERAHHELQTADPVSGATVGCIAARWGFTHVSRFAQDYHERFGRHPHYTLNS